MTTTWLVALFTIFLFARASFATYKHDGTGNNVVNPNWGSVDSALVSEFGSHYPGDASGDSVSYAGRPSCCFLEPLFTAAFDTAGMQGLNQAQVIFGQFLSSHDAALTPGNDSEPIPNEACLSGHKRAIHHNTNPRTHPNKVTSFLELTVVYGETNAKALALRSLVRGELRHSANSNFLPKRCADLGVDIFTGGGDPNDVFCAGDVRVNENLYLLVIHTLFMREHNRLAGRVYAEHPSWTDEQIYQKARAINIAQYQHIAYYEWLPNVVGHSFFEASPLSAYQGYNPTTNPGYFSDSSQSIFRMSHTQIVNRILRQDEYGVIFNEESLITTAFQPGRLEAYGIEEWISGMANTFASQVGPSFPSELNTHPNPVLPDLHLMAIDCFRGRDFGLIDFNGLRQALGLPAVTSMSQISKASLNQYILNQYNSVNNIDEFVGLILEDHAIDSPIGPTLQRAMERQMLKTREGDRFWFENPNYTELTGAEKQQVHRISMAKIILRNSKLHCIQEEFFKMPCKSDMLCKIGNGFYAQTF